MRRTLKKNLISLIFCLLFLRSFYCTVHYVDEVSGDGDCSSRIDSCKLDVALSIALDDDIIEFVGTNVQDLDGPWTIAKNLTLCSNENVTLEGGDLEGVPFNFSSEVFELTIRNLTFRDFSTPVFANGFVFLTIESCIFENTEIDVFVNVSFFDVTIHDSRFYNAGTLFFDEVSGTFALTNSSFLQDENSTKNPKHRSFEIISYKGHEIKIHDSLFFHHNGFDISSKTSTGVLNVEIIDSTFSRNEAEEGGAFGIYSTQTIPLEVVVKNSNFLSNCATVRGGAFHIVTEGSLLLSIDTSQFDCNGYLSIFESSSDIIESGISCPYKCLEEMIIEKGSDYGGNFHVISEYDYDISIINTLFNNSGAAKSLQVEAYSDFMVYGTSIYAKSTSGGGHLQLNGSIMSNHYQGYPVFVTSFETQNILFYDTYFYHLYGQPDVNESLIGSGESDDASTTFFSFENGHQLTFPFYFNSRSEDVLVRVEDCVFDSQSKIDFRERCALDSQSTTLPSGLLFLDGHAENGDPGGMTADMSVIRTTILGVFQGDEGGCFRHDGFFGGYNVEIRDSYIEGCASCRSGGTIYVSGSTIATITGTTFNNSFAKGYGGALSIKGEGDREMELSGLSFFGSESWCSGGAVHVDTMSVNFTDCIFEGNVGKVEGGAISLYIYNENYFVGIYDCNFTDNQQNSAESSVDVGGGQVYIVSSSQSSEIPSSAIERCTFVGGWAMLDGGDIRLNQGYVMLIDNVFKDSRADRSGGSIYGSNSKVVIIRNYFQRSSAGKLGGSDTSDGSSAVGYGNGGSMFFVSDRTWERSVHIIDTVFDGEVVAGVSGGGIYAQDIYLILYNCNFTGCVAGEDGGCIYLLRSRLYFLNDSESVKVNSQVCYTDPFGEGEVTVLNEGVSVIQNGSASQGGGIFVGEESAVQTHQKVYFWACQALVGGGLYLGSPSFFPGNDVYFFENTGVYGAAICSVIQTPEMSSSSQLLFDNVALWYSCIHLKGNLGTFTSSVFFLGDYDYVLHNTKEIWDGMDCQDADSTNCIDYGSTPNEIERVDPKDHTTVLFDTIPSTCDETGETTTRTESFLELYPKEVFNIHLIVSDWNNQIFTSFPAFNIKIEGCGENPPSIITATEDYQTFSEVDNDQDGNSIGIIKFEDLSISGSSGEEYLIRFSFEFFDVLAEHILMIRLVECPYGKEPDVIGDDGSVEDMKTCLGCASGFYKFRVSNEKCRECSEGMDCENNIVEVLPDYWASVESMTGEVIVYQCVDNYCLGGLIQLVEEDIVDDSNLNDDDSDDDPTTTSSSSNRRTVSVKLENENCIEVSNTCEGNREGDLPLCSGCSDGYEMWNEECRECDSDDFNFLPFAALIFIQIVLFLYVHVTTTCTSGDGKIPSKKQEKYEKKIIRKLSRDKLERKSLLFYGEEQSDAANNSTRLLVDYIQMCFLVTNFGAWFKSNNDMRNLRNFFIGPINFFKNLFLFNPSFDVTGTGMGDTLSRCPFALRGEMVLFWRVVQQMFMLVLCLIPLFLTCCCCECPIGWIRSCTKLKSICLLFFRRKSERVAPDDGNTENSDSACSEKSSEDNLNQQKMIETDVVSCSEGEEEEEDGEIVIEDVTYVSYIDSIQSEENEQEEGGEFIHNMPESSDEDESSESLSDEEPQEHQQQQKQKSEEEQEQENNEEEEEETPEKIVVEQELLETIVFLEDKEKEIVRKFKYYSRFLRCILCIPRFLFRCTSYSAFRTTLVNLLLMLHTPLTLVLMDFLFCTRYENVGIRVIKYSFIECYTLSYNLWLFLFFLPLFIIVILFPIVVTCILCCNKGRLQHPRFRNAFGVFYESYRSKSYWFEIVVIFEKICLMLSNMVYNAIKISTHDLIGLNHTFHGVIIGGCLLIHQVFQPYESKFENRLQFLNLFSLLIMIGVQEEYYQTTSNIGMVISIMMFSVLVVSMGCCCFCRVKVTKKILCCCDSSKKNKKDNMKGNTEEKQIQTETYLDEKDDRILCSGSDGEDHGDEFYIEESAKD